MHDRGVAIIVCSSDILCCLKNPNIYCCRSFHGLTHFLTDLFTHTDLSAIDLLYSWYSEVSIVLRPACPFDPISTFTVSTHILPAQC